MLKMRLQRVGRRNDPSYRIVVVDSRTGPKSHKYTDRLGSYDAKTNAVYLEKEKVQHWLSNGVQVSDTVHNLLVREGVIDEPKRNALPKKRPIIDPEKEAAEASQPEESADDSETRADQKEGVETEANTDGTSQSITDTDPESNETGDAETSTATPELDATMPEGANPTPEGEPEAEGEVTKDEAKKNG